MGFTHRKQNTGLNKGVGVGSYEFVQLFVWVTIYI